LQRILAELFPLLQRVRRRERGIVNLDLNPFEFIDKAADDDCRRETLRNK
jgi:hypothetical protein